MRPKTKQKKYKYLSICWDRSFASTPSGARFQRVKGKSNY